MGLALLDSSTVIGYLDADDLLHEEATTAVEAALRAGTRLALCAVTWAELLHGAHLGHRDETAVREFVDDFGIAILPVDAAVAERAAELQRDYAAQTKQGGPRRLKTPDALILACADLDEHVASVIGGDDKWRRVRGLRPDIKQIRERRH